MRATRSSRPRRDGGCKDVAGVPEPLACTSTAGARGVHASHGRGSRPHRVRQDRPVQVDWPRDLSRPGAPSVNVVTSPSSTRPSASPSKRDDDARPHAVQRVPAAPAPSSPSPDRFSTNELPSSSSRPINERSVALAPSRVQPSPNKASPDPRSHAPPSAEPPMRSASAKSVSRAAGSSSPAARAAPGAAPPALPSSGIACPPSVTWEPPPEESSSRSPMASTHGRIGGVESGRGQIPTPSVPSR